MRVGTIFLPALMLLSCSATTPDESYQIGGEWTVTITPLKLPAAARGAKGYTKSSCKPPLGQNAYPQIGQEKELIPGVICRVVEISPFDGPYRRVDQCRTAKEADARRITYVGNHSPSRYTLTITTEVPGQAEMVVIVREDGELKGPCSPKDR
jgi:hypothetical protein